MGYFRIVHLPHSIVVSCGPVCRLFVSHTQQVGVYQHCSELNVISNSGQSYGGFSMMLTRWEQVILLQPQPIDNRQHTAIAIIAVLINHSFDWGSLTTPFKQVSQSSDGNVSQ
jgi:hypothetical protein